MKRTPILLILIMLVIGSLLFTGCLGVQPSLQTATATATADEPPVETSAPQDLETPLSLATPYADSPTAGICAEAPGESVVSVEIFPDIPTPRCLRVSADQKLQVINGTDSPLQVSLGAVNRDIQPGAEATLDLAFGEYLAPGVHLVTAAPYSGPEIWLMEE